MKIFFDPTFLVYRDEESTPLDIPLQEMRILRFLMAHKRVISRAEIIAACWLFELPSNPRIVDVLIHRIRQRIGGSCIFAISKRGYRFNETFRADVSFGTKTVHKSVA